MHTQSVIGIYRLFQWTKTTYTLVILLSVQMSCDDSKNNKIPDYTILISRTDSEVVIDGHLNESIWQSSQVVTLRESKSGKVVNDSTVMTWVRTCYNHNYLFISFVCHDQDIWGNFSQRDQHLWTEEVVEVFIDTDDEEDTYVEIEISPHNILFDSYIVNPVNIDFAATKRFDLAGIKSAVSVYGTLDNRNDVDQKWIVEIAIPFKDLVNKSVDITPGKNAWKINFYRINRDRDKQSELYAWSPTGSSFHKPSLFGTLIFNK